MMLYSHLLLTLFVVIFESWQVSPFNKRSSRIKRIIGGTSVRKGEWPWLVSLHGKIPTNYFLGVPLANKNYYCGASLIGKNWILTAAHCFILPGYENPKANQWEAKIGETKVQTTFKDRLKGTISKVANKPEWTFYNIKGSKIIVHPKYAPKDSYRNDIALMKLQKEVSLDIPIGEDQSYADIFKDSFHGMMGHSSSSHGGTSRVGLVTLAGPDDSFLQDNVTCTMKGWGCTSNGGRISDDALEVNMPKVNDRYCAYYWGITTDSRICAGGNGNKEIGICSGDSGGPLVCPYGNVFVQVGLASFTSASSPGKSPGVFTRISAFRKWIDSVVSSN